MKQWVKIICGLFLFVFLTGCAIYGVAVDERNVKTIAADGKIKASIVSGFVGDDLVKILYISTYCYSGHVYLIGEYDQETQRDRVVTIAKGIKGVRSVTPYLLAKRKGDLCGMTDNLSVLTKVKAKLIGDKTIHSTNIDVEVVQCQVVLLGIVETRNEIEKAVTHAGAVEGVRKVKSFLKAVR